MTTDELVIGGVRYAHPSTLGATQRRENTASLLDRFATLHERVAAQGTDPVAQRQGAVNARRAAARVRSAG